MVIKKMIKKVAAKAADGVSKLSELSPQQLEKVQAQMAAYREQMPDLTSDATEEYFRKQLAIAGVEVYNAYLPQLKDLYLPIDNKAEFRIEDEGVLFDEGEFKSGYNIRYINITKWVTDKRENSLEKLVSVYEVLSTTPCNISLVFHRKQEETSVYLAVTNTENADSNADVDSYRKRLVSAIKGNFPGSAWTEELGRGSLPCFEDYIPYSVATASNIPTEKSEKFISQTIEKLLDGIVPENKEQEYVLVLLATPVLDVADRKLHLSQIYSNLSPYAAWQTQFQLTESDSRGSSATVGVNIGASVGSQTGHNLTQTHSQGQTESRGTSETETNTKGSGWQAGASFIINGGVNRNKSKSIAKGITNTLGKTASVANAVGKTVSSSLGANFGANFARTSSVTATIGKNEGINQSFVNHHVQHALKNLDKQMERLELSTALGLWDFSAYVLSEDPTVANNVAHSYLALTQGEESHLSQTVVNLWRGDVVAERDKAKAITAYLKDLRHPLFGFNPEILEFDEDFAVYPEIVTAATPLSGKELAYALNFPQKSIAGLPVLECAQFGRNISTFDEKGIQEQIPLGNIFHMNHEENTAVQLSLPSLASHTFVTGSTGTGKSNTVYQLLAQARRKGIKFLVVEPAKGEYKQVFGSDEDVAVFGTNPSVTPLLKINPFSFPEGVHVLEHLDRLVELFNVCWPMYAAMPAVLKKAIEQAYRDCGWDLISSENAYSKTIFPTFADVLRTIKEIIDSSEYDDENKGAYKGALLTRLESLTTGIYQLMFTEDEISSRELFDENVIVDLSRLGSSETKSLIMGLLVLKMQEYRMASSQGMNQLLRHVTVLEEAHNLLKRTSTEQATESSNLLGKSVEMLTNAIAEMRTYGEGFIIADQAPGLLDLAVIRNTNTKIILRLPEYSDRELVGKAANLNEDQINELAKLPKGVAAVYQNEWLEPVLCKVAKYDSVEKVFQQPTPVARIESPYHRLAILELLSASPNLDTALSFTELRELTLAVGLDSLTQVRIFNFLQSASPDNFSMHDLAHILGKLYPELVETVRLKAEKGLEPVALTQVLQQEIDQNLPETISQQARRDLVQGLMTYYYLFELKDHKAMQDWLRNGGLI
ncbi:TPA: ATP-binding protein [Streptococcus suis]|nr:ATP-binding protein [Streptococcus suis]HEM3607915.1 ATP-binding protein [Streptococcus suis]HEM3646367.1 ATP-binding protein [Streptococcus suis]HEM3687936.1 ATP-binding protein [Streptococcus suis]